MGKQKIFVLTLVFLFIFAFQTEAFYFPGRNFHEDMETKKEEIFQKHLQKLCTIRIRINKKFPWFPVPQICQTQEINPPTLEFYAEPESIVEGEGSTLTWASNNTVSCEATSGWEGEKALSGEEKVYPVETVEYVLTCDGIEEGIEKSVIVEVEPVDVPPDCIDINTASKEELDEIINIGPATADKIIEYRQTTPFTSVEDLINISGIGEVTLNEIIEEGLACVIP